LSRAGDSGVVLLQLPAVWLYAGGDLVCCVSAAKQEDGQATVWTARTMFD